MIRLPLKWKMTLLHTEEHRFCYDPTCGCHEAPLLIAEVGAGCDRWIVDPTRSH